MTAEDETRADTSLFGAARGDETTEDAARRLAAEVSGGERALGDAISRLIARSGFALSFDDAASMIREAQAEAAEGHDATLTFPAIPADLAAPRPPAITCGDCGETFAQAAFGGRGLFLAETLHAAAVAAGWTEKPEGAWTCTVCLAKAAAPPAPEAAAPAVEPEPAPGGDPYDQSIAILDEFNAKVPGIWDEVNRSNNATAHKNTLRFGDGYHGFEALFSRTPGLRDDPETAVALLNYEADLAERAEAMHRESEERLAKLRETDSEEAAA